MRHGVNIQLFRDIKCIFPCKYIRDHTLPERGYLPRRGMDYGMPSGYTLSDEVRREHDMQIRFLNPGSCGPKRFRLPVTMMVLILYPAAHRLEVEKIDFASPVPVKEDTVEIPEKDRYRLIKEIMKEVDAGKNISEIAAKHRINEKFTEQVCRMYLTHPGVDVDGIMDRIERRNL